MKPILVFGLVFLAIGLPFTIEARSIVDLQPFKSTQTRENQARTLTLVNLNTNVNKWYLLVVRDKKSPSEQTYHLENPLPHRQSIVLREDAEGIEIIEGNLKDPCRLFKGRRSILSYGERSKSPYYALCQNKIYLRNQVSGNLSTKELAVDFLRDHVWSGEEVISFIKDTVYKDAELITAALSLDGLKSPDLKEKPGPKPAFIHKTYQRARLSPGELGIHMQADTDGMMQVGEWYPSSHHEDIFVSVIQPQLIDQQVLSSYGNRVLPFDATERSAVVYLVAFDLEDFELGYSTGTEHPEVSYSERTAPHLKKPGWSGPDGFSTYAPIKGTGMLNPLDASRVVATFTGGFKRKHSVFRAGVEATRNGGTHYGFMQNGVIFSSLYPNLASAIIDRNGQIILKTWEDGDEKNLADYVFVRQNGFPLVAREKQGELPVPGEHVRTNFRGNWSGSKQNTVRALRTGMCLQSKGDKKYLMYGFFSSHTPNAMARVFQAYDCDYAMHLDMNMIVHTYLATYFQPKDSKELKVEHIVKKMKWKDTEYQGQVLPRFVAVPDNRDFFYLLRKSSNRPLLQFGTKVFKHKSN